MAQATGASAKLILQEETTYKTSPASPNATLLYFISEEIKYSRNLIDSTVIRGSRDAAMPVLGNVDVVGTINTELQAYIAELLKFTFGKVTTTGSASPYTHKFTIGSTLPSFLIEKGFTDLGQYLLYNGCKVNKMSLTIKSEGFQEISFDIIGAKETVATSSFDSTPTDRGKYSWTGFDIATIEEGGTAIANVQEVSLTVENNLDNSVYVIGSAGERISLPAGIVKVSGTVKALFDSITLYTKAKQSTETSLKIKYQFGTGAGTAGNESMEIYIPELKYSPNAPVITGPAGILVEMPFSAYYDNNTDASSIVVTLKNTQETV